MRKYLEEATSERDRELDELSSTNALLLNQLKEKEGLQSQYNMLQKEVYLRIFLAALLLLS